VGPVELAVKVDAVVTAAIRASVASVASVVFPAHLAPVEYLELLALVASQAHLAEVVLVESPATVAILAPQGTVDIPGLVDFLVHLVPAEFLDVADSAAILVSQVHLEYQVHQVKVDFLADLAGAALVACQASQDLVESVDFQVLVAVACQLICSIHVFGNQAHLARKVILLHSFHLLTTSLKWVLDRMQKIARCGKALRVA